MLILQHPQWKINRRTILVMVTISAGSTYSLDSWILSGKHVNIIMPKKATSIGTTTLLTLCRFGLRRPLCTTVWQENYIIFSLKLIIVLRSIVIMCKRYMYVYFW